MLLDRVLWDPKELVRAAMSTDSFFEVWEVFTPGVNIY